METAEFFAILQELEDVYGAEWQERQRRAWFSKLRHLTADEFRQAAERISVNLTSLPFHWNLVAEVCKAQVQTPGSKPETFQRCDQDEAHWQNGLAKIRAIKANLAQKFTIPAPEDFEAKRQDALAKLNTERKDTP